MFGKATISFWQYLLIVILFSGMGVGIGYGTWHNVTSLPTPSPNSMNNTEIYIGGKSYFIASSNQTLIQVNESTSVYLPVGNWTFNVAGFTYHIDVRADGSYFLNSLSYVAPTPIICLTPSSSCPSRSCYDIITAPPCYIVPTPTPSPCTWPIERTSYSFCGKVTVNSSDEFDRLLKDIEKHSYHIQMGWMHLDYEYAHKTYDNTLPAPVNICMGVIPSDNFPMGSEWEGRMAYTIDDCAPFGSCDFDTLALIPTPTPTPKEQEP